MPKIKENTDKLIVKETKIVTTSSIKGSDFDSWDPERKKEFLEVISLGAGRYFGEKTKKKNIRALEA